MTIADCRALAAIHAGDVQQRIDPAAFLDDAIDERLQLVALADVAADAEALAFAGRSDFLRRRFGDGRLAPGDDDGRPAGKETFGQGPTDAPRSARDEDDLLGNVE